VARDRSVAALLGVLLAAVWMLLLAPHASAHATLLSTDPTHDSVLAEAPDAVTLTFDEPVEVWETSVSVFDPDGERLPVEARAVDAEVVSELPADLQRGTYTVSWRVVSADDHPISGGFAFSIGERTATPTGLPDAQPEKALDITRQVADAIGYLGLLGAVGLAIFELVLLDATAGAMPHLRGRLRMVRRVLGAAAVLGLAASAVLSTVWQQGGSLGDLAESQTWVDALTSHAAVSTMLAAFGLVVVVTWTEIAARVGGPRWLRYGVGAAAVVALASLPWVGHTRAYGPTWLVVAADLVHVAAGAVWIGGVIGLILTLSRTSDASATRAISTVRRFSAVAGWTVVTVAVAGTVLAWRILGSVDDLFDTSYGRALLVKVAVVALVVLTAAANRLVLLPRLAADPTADLVRTRLRRMLAVEAAGLVVVLGVTSVLVTQPPGADGSTGSATTSSSGAVRGIEEDFGTGLVRVRMSPVTVGRNYVQVYLRDAEGEPLRVLETPSLRFGLESEGLGPLPAELTRVGPGQYEGSIDLPVAGAWLASISARTSTYRAPTAVMTFEVG